MNKYFPIKTDTACQLKWTWSTVFLNDGTTASCHRVGRHPIPIDNFDKFHNTEEKIRQRESMLRGEWPQPLEYMHDDEGCRYCEKIEKSGGHSDRQHHLTIPNLSPKELEVTPNAVIVTPKILEVFINNTCNLSCTYCNASNSSQIERENNKFGNFNKNGVTIPIKTIDRNLNQQYIEKLFTWLENNSNELRRLHILGGEPLYQKEFYRCVDFFKTHPNRELELNLVTNLMLAPAKFQLFLQQVKQMMIQRCIKRFDITVSLDCWGDEQEYARSGIKLDTIEKNMQTLLDEKWVYLNINSTLTPLTIRTFPDLIKKINEWRTVRSIHHYFQTVFNPSYHNPEIFGGEVWRTDFELALSLMQQTNPQEITAFNYLNGIWSQLQSTCENTEKIVQLITHLTELDRRRNTNWRQVFPWLIKYEELCGITK